MRLLSLVKQGVTRGKHQPNLWGVGLSKVKAGVTLGKYQPNLWGVGC